MDTQDQYYKIIKEIENTQEQLEHETDATKAQHLRDYLNHTFKRLTQLTHEHSVNEREDAGRER